MSHWAKEDVALAYAQRTTNRQQKTINNNENE